MAVHPETLDALASLAEARRTGRPAFVQLPGRSPRRTLRIVRELGLLYGHHPDTRRIAADITSGVHGRDAEALARGIHRWVRDNVRFLPEAGEQLQTPFTTYVRRFGDCDDHAALVMALATSLRLPCRPVLLSDGRRAFHVLCHFNIGGRWVDAETCEPSARWGEHPASIMRRISARL